MAWQQADEPPHDQAPSELPASLRWKTERDEQTAAQGPWNFPPEFYDNLSTVWLTPLALRELDRRNACLSPPKLTKHIGDFAQGMKKGRLDLARFAWAGGPTLVHLRGYPEPASIVHAMASIPSSETTKRGSAGGQIQSTKATTVTVKTRRSSAYDANFGQHCVDNGIYPPVYKFPDGSRPPKPKNFEEIRQALSVPRGSLSPSIVPETAFEDFEDKNATKSKGMIMRTVVPLIAGDADILNEGYLPFINLALITNNTIIYPVPDFFDGTHPDAIDKRIREDLNGIIVPNKKVGVPIAPNFFLEVKGPMGTMEVAVAQAVLDGAHGALAMHTLQNYLLDEPIYDGNAYAFSSTLLDGYLKLYAHHMAAPATLGQGPRYYITPLRAYALSDDGVYSEGRGAFRNLRMRAKGDRDSFIEIANARARNQGTGDMNSEDDAPRKAIDQQQDGGSSPLDFYECQTFADEAQETQESNVGLAILHQPYGKDADDTGASIDLAMSFASSFTSVSREDPPHHGRQKSKLPRTPPSPSSTRARKC
ncbi:hypothetical protein ACQKWADRAFT_210330 [Trichoderma austrokoningii]